MVDSNRHISYTNIHRVKINRKLIILYTSLHTYIDIICIVRSNIYIFDLPPVNQGRTYECSKALFVLLLFHWINVSLLSFICVFCL